MEILKSKQTCKNKISPETLCVRDGACASICGGREIIEWTVPPACAIAGLTAWGLQTEAFIFANRLYGGKINLPKGIKGPTVISPSNGKAGLMKSLLLMHSGVSYNRITENVQKALLCWLDSLCLVCQRVCAPFSCWADVLLAAPRLPRPAFLGLAWGPRRRN